MKPSEIIDKALTEVMPTADAWMRGDYANEDGSKHCAIGSLFYASGQYDKTCTEWLAAPDQTKRGPELEAAMNKLRDVVADLGFTPKVHQMTIISEFNDTEGRTYDEVRAVMEKARAGLQEAGE